MQVSFYLDKSHTDKLERHQIFYSLTFQSNRIRKKVKNAKVKLDDWNPKSSRIKPSKKNDIYNNYLEYNKEIEELESKINKISRFYLLNGITPTRSQILNKLKSTEEVQLAPDFFPSYKEFIKTSKNKKAERTIKGYTTVYNYLKDYVEYQNTTLQFEDINNDFFDNLQEYAFNVKMSKNNYFSRIITTLKTFMRWSEDLGYHSNHYYSKFKAKEKDIEIIYLTLDELMQLYRFEFEKEKHDKVRDLWCFSAFCGLRVSDLMNISYANVHESYLNMNIIKTKEQDQIIPLNKYAKEILNKYNEKSVFTPLPRISTQKFNKYIKEAVMLAGIDDSVTITRYRGQDRIDITKPKHQFISSHNARKTFAMNSILLGMNHLTVRKIIGQKKESSFRKYAQATDALNMKEMNNTWDKL